MIGVYYRFGDKWLCVTNFSYDCSANFAVTNDLDGVSSMSGSGPAEGVSSMSGSGPADLADSKILLAKSDDPPTSFSATNITLNDLPADPASIPEPGTLPLLLFGLLMLGSIVPWRLRQ
jgi:hypothetical protein